MLAALWNMFAHRQRLKRGAEGEIALQLGNEDIGGVLRILFWTVLISYDFLEPILEEYACCTLPPLFKKQKTVLEIFSQSSLDMVPESEASVAQSDAEASSPFYEDVMAVPPSEPDSSRKGLNRLTQKDYSRMSKREYRFFNRTKLLADGLRAIPLPHAEKVTQALERMERMHNQIRIGQTWRPCNRDLKAACQEAQGILDWLQ